VPLTIPEVQHVSQRAHGLRHGRDLVHLRGVSPLARSSPSVSSISGCTVLHSDQAGQDIEEDYVHLQVCNSCAEVRLFSFPPAFSSDIAPILSPSSASGINASTAPHCPTRTTWYVKLRTSQVI